MNQWIWFAYLQRNLDFKTRKSCILVLYGICNSRFMGFVPQSFTLAEGFSIGSLETHQSIFIAAIFRQWKIHRSMELNGYGSIPIDTIFSGMNIHKSQLWLGVNKRYQGFDPSPNGWFSIAMLPSMGCRNVTRHCATLLHPTDHLDVARCQVRPDSWRHAQQKTLRVQPPECAAGQLCAKFSSRDWTRMTTVPWQKRRCPRGNSWGIQEVFHNH